MEVLRLVLVDDYRMVTEALASRLSTAPDLWVAGCCQTDDPRLPEVVRWLRPDIVLIDVEPLGFAIAEVLSRIKAAWPAANMIVVSADDDASHAVEAARAGADAWVSKSQGADQLETVLRGVARGHAWFPPEMLGEVLRGLREDVQAARESSNLLDTLSPRELDVLTSMAKGKRARQIAAELMISADTVRTHTRSIFGKLEVHSRIEAVSVAWAAGLRPGEAKAPGQAQVHSQAPGQAQAHDVGEDEVRGQAQARTPAPARPRAPAPAGGQALSGDQPRAVPGRGRSPDRRPQAVRNEPDRPGPGGPDASGTRHGSLRPGRTELTSVELRRAEAGGAEAGRGGTGRAETGRGGAGRAEAGSAEAGSPEAGSPEAGSPEAGRAGAGRAATGRPPADGPPVPSRPVVAGPVTGSAAGRPAGPAAASGSATDSGRP
jgi:two-component system, NarL family, response regulator LiaR